MTKIISGNFSSDSEMFTILLSSGLIEVLPVSNVVFFTVSGPPIGARPSDLTLIVKLRLMIRSYSPAYIPECAHK